MHAQLMVRHLVLSDSTGYGILQGTPMEGHAGVIQDESTDYIVSLGSCLHDKGQLSTQPSLASLVASSLSTPFLQQTTDIPLKFVVIPAHDSVRKGQNRFEQLVTYRKDMTVPEFSRTILSYQERFPSLYTKADRYHFHPSVAQVAFKTIMQDAIAEASANLGNEVLVVVVCAGWNAEPDKGRSRREALCLRHLLLCGTVTDLVLWSKMHSGTNFDWWRGVDHLPVPPVVHQTYLKEHDDAKANMNLMMPSGFKRHLFLDAECESYIRETLGLGRRAARSQLSTNVAISTF